MYEFSLKRAWLKARIILITNSLNKIMKEDVLKKDYAARYKKRLDKLDKIICKQNNEQQKINADYKEAENNRKAN